MADKIDDLNGLEINLAERTAGIPLEALGDDTKPKFALLAALAWVHIKRDEPKLTFDAYMKRVKAAEVYEYLYGQDEDEVPADPFPDGDGPAAAGAEEGGVLSEDGDRAERV